VADAPGYSPPFGALYVESVTSPAVLAAVDAFGRGRSSLYDTHPHHTALIASCATDVVPEQPVEDPGEILDGLLIANAFTRRFPDIVDEPSLVIALAGVRAGALLAGLLEAPDVDEVMAALADVGRRPWIVADVTGVAEDHHLPLAAFESAVWALTAPLFHADAVALVADLEVPTAVADLTTTLVLASASGSGHDITRQLAPLVANEAFTSTWTRFRGPALFVLERLARGRVLVADDLEVLARLLRLGEFLKLVPSAGTRGHFDLAESFVDQSDDVRAHLRSLWTSTFSGELHFDAARAAHLSLCGKESP